MSGEIVSAEARLAHLDAKLNEYETGLGLRQLVVHNEAEQYFNISHAELRKLSAEQCGEAAVVLAGCGLHLQRSYNQEFARMSWAEEETRKVIASELCQYNGATAEERKLLAIRGNEYASKLDRIRLWAKARADRLSYVASRVEFLSKTLMELQQTRRRQSHA